MEFGNYQFLIRLIDDALLPCYKGSTFRGLLGHALKRVACPLKLQNCSTCILRTTCTYALVFETALAVSLPENARISAPPHPIVIEPPLTEKREFSKGETLECGLLLFGDINRHLPYFIYAFDQMGKIGIGRKIRGQRARFVLEKVSSNGMSLTLKKNRTIDLPDALHLNFNLNEQPLFFPGDRLKIHMVTPLRILKSNCDKAALPFSLFLSSMVRRTTSLLNCYGKGEPKGDYALLINKADAIKTVKKHFHWTDWKRYSNRQERKMFMGGLTGSVVYEGDLTPFMGIVEMSQKVHVGKNTAFGLGKIKIESYK
ncbi:MAG: CRISPR system precrRNA processing endoribonuclease RAMP protein Cas6 [Desulfobacula sp.]|jgi:hypothetical protein|nr:CRISPR system precrRNA processing endoribonuclease RAMP protein Cas6 [Desulfobacula sp.]